MKQVIKIFKQLQNTSGKKDKEAILVANADNELFKQCLIFLLDDNITTGIAKKKYDSIRVGTSDWVHKDINKELLEMFKYIKANNTGKDENILNVKAWCHDFDEESKEFVKGMITKSIKLGIDKRTVNKVFPNLIFEWKVQLGSPSDKLKLKKGEKFFLSQKLNGFRGSYVDGQFISRQGKQITGLQHIIDDIYALSLDTYFLDGELIRKNTDNVDDNTNFRLSASIINSDADSKPEIEFVIFDMFPKGTIVGDKTVENYSIRKQRLLDVKKIIEQTGVQNLKIVEMVYEGTDASEIDKWLDRAVEWGWEGLILNKDTPYEFKRTTNLIKLKKFFDIALRCVSVNIADAGKYKGMMGSITCKYGDGFVDCGSGFSDEDRKYYAAHPEDIVGKIVSIKYKEESQNKDGGKSLQFPTYLALVMDKLKPDDET